jgi:DNA-binding transcriptional LysR family regulator
LPLVLLDAPCPLRQIVTAALERAGIPWRHAFNSASLAALWAATSAGLGLSVRTAFGLPAHVRLIDPLACGLPELPPMDLVLGRARGTLDVASERLASLLLEAVREHLGLAFGASPLQDAG